MRNGQRTIGLLALAALTAGGVSLAAQREHERYRQASSALSGTYQLETTRGDDPRRAAERATGHLQQPQRDRVYRHMLARLQPPTMIAIDRDGRTVTIVSTAGPRVTFDADGRVRDESGPYGRTTVTRASFAGDRLSVSTTGNRDTDFLVTFEPVDDGNGLLVTRRLDSEDLSRPVTIQSYYRRVDSRPRWDLDAEGPRDAPELGDAPRSEPRNHAVPGGTRIVAVLDTPLSTRTSRNGERFSMTVRSPGAFQGDRIDGVVSRVTPYDRDHDADMRIDFDAIHFRDGRTAGFDAILETVRTPDGATLRVDTSGELPASSRTEATLQHGAIGAALGAVIGAIAAGGKGAAVGAVAGGAGGAILAQHEDQHLDLPPGSEVTIVATPPHERTP